MVFWMGILIGFVIGAALGAGSLVAWATVGASDDGERERDEYWAG